MFTARKMGKVFFVNSGSEANDTQVFFLLANKGRKNYETNRTKSSAAMQPSNSFCA